MGYSIHHVAEKCNLTVHTLRYYDKEGLLPFVGRDGKGNRLFVDRDVEWVNMICCFRDSGMPICDIKRYVDLCMQGPDTYLARKQILVRHKYKVEDNIARLSNYLYRIERKLELYDEIIAGKRIDACNPAVVSKS